MRGCNLFGGSQQLLSQINIYNLLHFYLGFYKRTWWYGNKQTSNDCQLTIYKKPLVTEWVINIILIVQRQTVLKKDVCFPWVIPLLKVVLGSKLRFFWNQTQVYIMEFCLLYRDVEMKWERQRDPPLNSAFWDWRLDTLKGTY